MRGKLFARAALIATLLAPAATWADGPSKTHAVHGKAAINPKAAQETLSDADLKILSHVHDVNVTEIEMGQLASLRASNKAVKAYADMIVRDHQKADKQAMAIAKARGAILSTTPSDPDEIAAQQKSMEMMDQLRGTTGPEFDRMYLAAMADGHDRELQKTDVAITNVADARLRGMLKTVRPVLVKHATQAKELLAKQTEKAKEAGTKPTDHDEIKRP